MDIWRRGRDFGEHRIHHDLLDRATHCATALGIRHQTGYPHVAKPKWRPGDRESGSSLKQGSCNMSFRRFCLLTIFLGCTAAAWPQPAPGPEAQGERAAAANNF